MTQIVVTLDNYADVNLLRRMIENMKGVVKATLSHSRSAEAEKESPKLIDSLHAIKSAIDPSVIDLSDPRTNYIMSK